MSANLILAVFTFLAGLTTLVLRFVVPVSKERMDDPIVRMVRDGLFAPLVFGLVPMVAGVTFFGAWLNARG